MVKIAGLVFLAAASLPAQATLTLSANPAAVKAGQPVTVTATLAGGTSPAEAGVRLTVPPQLTSVTAALNPAIVSKTLFCSVDFSYCIAMGVVGGTVVNNGAIPDGALLSWTGTVAAGSTGSLTVAIAAGSGTVQLLSGTQASITITPPVALTIPILSACDLNGDGKIDASDLILLVNWIVGRSTPGAGQTCDVNGDGRCDLLDLGVIFTAALGGACAAH